MKPVEKVLAYITRNRDQTADLLVFRHRDYPDAGTQVPAGTVERTETTLQALVREIKEETGLTLSQTPKFLGRFEYPRLDRNELHFRNVFHIHEDHALPDRWSHTVAGKGNDEGLVFEFEWITIDKARDTLEANQGAYLTYINLPS